MGLGGIHIWHLLIILAIVVLIFGTKRLKSIGGDLGGAFKGFKKAMDNDDEKSGNEQPRLESDDDDAEFPEQKKKNKSRSA